MQEGRNPLKRPALLPFENEQAAIVPLGNGARLLGRSALIVGILRVTQRERVAPLQGNGNHARNARRRRKRKQDDAAHAPYMFQKYNSKTQSAERKQNQPRLNERITAEALEPACVQIQSDKFGHDLPPCYFPE